MLEYAMDEDDRMNHGQLACIRGIIKYVYMALMLIIIFIIFMYRAVNREHVQVACINHTKRTRLYYRQYMHQFQPYAAQRSILGGQCKPKTPMLIISRHVLNPPAAVNY